MQLQPRPTLVKAHAMLLVTSAALMALIGWSASGYFMPALCLLLQAGLLWRGRGYALFTWILVVNQASGLGLVLVLWLGGSLGDLRLDLAGAMLLLNLLAGGPLLSLLALGLLPSLHRGRRLFSWFHPVPAAGAGA